MEKENSSIKFTEEQKLQISLHELQSSIIQYNSLIQECIFY